MPWWNSPNLKPMKIKFLFLGMILFSCYQVKGQSIDCAGENVQIGLRQGRMLTVPCDSMILLTKQTYGRIILEKQLGEKAFTVSEQIMESQKELANEYKRYADTLESYIRTTQPKIDTLQLLLDQSIKNTEEAVTIARRNKFLWGSIGVAAGILLGLVLAN